MNEQTSNPNATNKEINEQAAVSSLPVSPEAKPEVVTEVQPEVQKETDSQAADKRKQVLDEAVSALALTKSALAALDGKDAARALATLAEVTGKLELIVAREPTLALAPVDVRTIVHDLFANTETIEAMTDEALDALKHGEVQQARHVLALLASEIVIAVTNIPLASYPAAVKSVVPLIDQGKIEEAKAALQAALSTLVETRSVHPLPALRARLLLKRAEPLVEDGQRSEASNERLETLLNEARQQLEMAELLGYGKRKDFESMYDELKKIKQKTGGGGGGKGWLDEVKAKLSRLF
ncbi:TPA: heat resistance protein YfdX2 [Pseudomonas aeruginosa]|uniref:heat resistance protein YfdX2 n=1 Tax=Gammaproteobacteria TaxID=1236 RepID=UPI0006680A4C|nr:MULTISPECIES: heat resistance protein YfdX2 [Gammaproteobacteria]ELK2665262.1 heat resistance protein YfdX2 [Stenotrophomonas maltophilia]MBH1376198.1 heat resistance protein YfdX2 [Stenotrophomonas maltophilia]MBH1439121.1 heat resistance protein YfdX2 [Stenotrophomonas maltophilia]MBH1557862.1 heat resistance protein YfdX2 [Stenotrophomonas maltophilia]MBN4986011.1 heat resistance protein YfdX2 [Stenotrophomonas maltophilia]